MAPIDSPGSSHSLQRWRLALAAWSEDPGTSRARHLLAVLLVVAATVLLFGTAIDRAAIITHESVHPYLRTHQLVAELRAFHIPPVALPEALGGAGAAFFLFYPPFAYFVSAVLSVLSGDFVLGVNLSFFLSVLASGLALYFMGITLGADRLTSAAGALVYISVPYRFVEIFIRGALAEAWTFVWFPLIVAGAFETTRSRRIPLYLPIAIAGLFITHPISSLYSLPIFGLLAVFALLGGGWNAVGRLLAAGLLALGLSFWYVFPQQYYLGDVRAGDPEFFLASARSVGSQRVPVEALLGSSRSNWKPHLDQFFYTGVTGAPPSHALGANELSRELGAGHLVALGLAVWLLAATVSGRVRVRRDVRALAYGLFGLWSAYLLFMVAPEPILALLPRPFHYVQFPWRMLGFVAFFAAALLPLTSSALRLRGWGRAGVLAAALLVVLLVPDYQREKWQDVLFLDESITPQSLREAGGRGFTVLGDYLPRDLPVSARVATPSSEPVAIGDVTIGSWSRRGLDVDVAVQSPNGGMLLVPLVYYDFHRAETSGGAPLPTRSLNGVLAVEVPRGTSAVIEVRQTITPPMWAGILVSMLSALVLVVIAVWQRRRRWRSESALRSGVYATAGAVEPSRVE